MWSYHVTQVKGLTICRDGRAWGGCSPVHPTTPILAAISSAKYVLDSAQEIIDDARSVNEMASIINMVSGAIAELHRVIDGEIKCEEPVPQLQEAG